MSTLSTMNVLAVVFLSLILQSVARKRELFNCNFEDPRSSLCGFRVRFPQKSLEHREEQWDVRRASESRGGRDGPRADRTLNTPQGSYGYTKAMNQTGRYFYSFRVMIVSPSLVLSSGRGRLSFSAYLWTHLHPVKKADNLPTFRVRGCDDEISWSLQGRTAAWQEVDIPINCNKTFQLVLEAIHRMPGSSVAVDDIRVTSMLDLKDHVSNRVTSSSFDPYDVTSTSPPTTTREGDGTTVNRSLLITLSGPTIGAIVGIILVILLLNLLIFIILRFKVKSGKRRQASLRRQNKPRNTEEPPHDVAPNVNKFPLPAERLKTRYIDEDNYIVPDEGFYADDHENTCDSFMDTSTSGDTQRSSETHYTGLSLVRTSLKDLQERTWEGPENGGERKDSMAQERPTLSYSVKRKAPLKPTLSLRSNDRREESSPPKQPLSPSQRKESLTPEALIFNTKGKRKESLTPDLPLSSKAGKRKESLTPEIPLPLYKRKESLTPEIPVMLVTGRRKESLTPEIPVAPKVSKRKESLVPRDTGSLSGAGKRKESLTPEVQVPPQTGRRKESLTTEKPIIIVPGRRKQSLTPETPSPAPPTGRRKESLTPETPSPAPPTGRRKESLTPETPTMPLPDIPRVVTPTITVSGDTFSSTGYTELSHNRESIRKDYENANIGKDNTSDKNSTPKSNLLNVSQDETGYLTPSGLSTGLPVYECADTVTFARERSKRKTRKLIHEYHDLTHSNNKTLPQYESTMILGTTPPKRMTISTIWDADSDYEELHI